MLVLTRKNKEAVVVGGSDGFEHLLKVTVLDISAGRVRLGFEIDGEVPVKRFEVWEKSLTVSQPECQIEPRLACLV